jgi:hypothetical protein
MTAANNRLSARALAVAALLLVGSRVAPLRAQASMITMPKEAAQRAVGASNAQLQSQIGQAQSAAQGPASRTNAGTAQGAASQGQGAGATPGVVQSGTTRPGEMKAAGAPDPGAGRMAPGTSPAAPDPSNVIMREVFEYGVEGRRDPFFSLMATGDIRPMLSDLRLTTILYDLSGRRPVAVMSDVTTNLQYRVTTGMMLGRMRVTQIRPRKVIFAIDEFGFSRADSLVLADKPQTR